MAQESVNNIIELLADISFCLLSAPELALPLKQRAKFEGWMKIALASALANTSNVSSVRVEESYCKPDMSRYVADVAFSYGEDRARVMLKTVNTNFRFEGVENAHRPITKNINSVIEDVHKLENARASCGLGYVVFAVFPVSSDEEKRTKQIALHVRKLHLESISADKYGFVPREYSWGVLYGVLSVR